MAGKKRMTKPDPDRIRDDERQRWDDYLRLREAFDRHRIEQRISLDRSVLTLSSGAIGLSLLIIPPFASDERIDLIEILVVSWILFVSSIVLTLISLELSSLAFEKAVNDLDKDMRGESIEESKIVHMLTIIMNRVSLILFVVGTACLLWFSFVNARQFDPASAITTQLNRSYTFGLPDELRSSPLNQESGAEKQPN